MLQKIILAKREVSLSLRKSLTSLKQYNFGPFRTKACCFPRVNNVNPLDYWIFFSSFVGIGKQFYFFFFFFGYFNHIPYSHIFNPTVMEEMTQNWTNLSLSDREGPSCSLDNDHSSQ